MRTTQKKLAHLMRSIRISIGVRTNAEVWQYVAKRLEEVESALSEYDVSAISITPYADNSWILHAYDSVDCKPGQFRNPRLYLSDDWTGDLEASVKDFARMLRPKAA